MAREWQGMARNNGKAERRQSTTSVFVLRHQRIHQRVCPAPSACAGVRARGLRVRARVPRVRPWWTVEACQLATLDACFRWSHAYLSLCLRSGRVCGKLTSHGATGHGQPKVGLYGTRGTRVTVSAGSLRTAQCVSHKGTMMRVFVARLCAHPQFHSGGKALASFSCCGRTMRMGNAAQSAHLLYGPPPSNGIACLHRALFKRGGNGGGFYKTSSPWCC
jgi:hypothetical protein